MNKQKLYEEVRGRRYAEEHNMALLIRGIFWLKMGIQGKYLDFKTLIFVVNLYV